MTSHIATDQIRSRPAMYVGSVGGAGVFHMVMELVGNALDQHLAGRCSQVAVTIEADGTIEVRDDGPGVTADPTRLLQLLTTLSDSPTVDGHAPHMHLGERGIGLCPIAALGAPFTVRTVRSGRAITVELMRGAPGPVRVEATEEPSGTLVRFRPDPTIFAAGGFVLRAELCRRLADLRALAPEFDLRLRLEGDHFARGGLRALVAEQANCPLEHVAHHRETCTPTAPQGPLQLEVALAVSDQSLARASGMHSFVNFQRTPEHGEHLAGVLAAVRAFVGTTSRRQVEERLVAAVTVVAADVLYGAPSHRAVVDARLRSVAKKVTAQALADLSARAPEISERLRAAIRRP